jgi:hypothetical protein
VDCVKKGGQIAGYKEEGKEKEESEEVHSGGNILIVDFV